MTENQLFLLSADLFDTSSNSSNLLKYDLYSFSLSSNSNSSSSLFGNALNTLSPSPSAASHNNTTTATNNNSSNSNSTSNSDNNTYEHAHIGSSNPMLTTAITIPRSSHSNQNHHHHLYLADDLHSQLSPMASHQPFGSQHNTMSASTSSSLLEQHQQQRQQQQDQDQREQEQQRCEQQQQQRFMADLSDYGLEALDASPLSPTLLQDVSLGAASPLNASMLSITPNGNVSSSSGFYANNTSSLSNSAGSSIVGSSNVDSAPNSVADTLPSNGAGGNRNHGDDTNPSSLYDDGQVQTPQSTAMWSDIGDAIITTKNEPFNLEDDYIFPIDKAEIQASFADLNDAHLLEVIGSFEEFLPITASDQCAQGDYLLSPPSSGSIQILNSPVMSPGGPPMQLLEQQQQQQMQTQPHSHNMRPSLQQQSQSMSHQQLQHQSSGGALHHTHHHHSSSSPYEIYHSTPNKSQLTNSGSTTFSPGSQSSHSPLLINSITPPPPPPPHANRSQYQQNMLKTRNMHDLLKKEFSMSPDRSRGSPVILGQSVPAGSQAHLSGNALSPGSGSSGFGSAAGGSGGSSIRKSFGYQTDASMTMRLSSSAPTHLGIENIWLRREPRQHLLSTGSLAEADSFSSLSTASVLSPDGIDLSQDDDDEDGSTDYNSDHYDDFSSDGTDNEDDARNPVPSHLSSSKSKERFFWQYNVQAKGPKGKRLVFQSKLEDPHVLNEVTDPVFSPNCSVRGIKVFKHSGKARKGDGNDLTPNPRKLHSIGRELDKLSRTINDMTPVSELPFNVRPKSRKEKNKLASRACRLKKKAQHEANKIKLFGLEIEHKRLLAGIADIKQALALKYRNRNLGESSEKIDQKIEIIYKTTIAGVRIAGGTTDFVNNVLDRVKSGVPSGGLEELRNT